MALALATILALGSLPAAADDGELKETRRRLNETMVALEELKSEVNQSRRYTAVGLIVAGTALGVYGFLNYSDARDANERLDDSGAGDTDVPTGRHLICACGGVLVAFIGLGL